MTGQVRFFAEESRHRLLAVIEDASQLGRYHECIDTAAHLPERKGVVNHVRSLNATSFDFPEEMLMMPDLVRADALLVHKVAGSIDMGDLRQPALRDSKKGPNTIFDHQAWINLLRRYGNDGKIERRRRNFGEIMGVAEESPALVQRAMNKLIPRKFENSHWITQRLRLSIMSGRPCRLFSLAGLLLSSCVSPDREHKIVISVPDQTMIVYEKGTPIAQFLVSTSKFCLGDVPGSRGTPLGNLEVAKKIGGDAASGSVFKNRRWTGEILSPDAPGRDPIVSRIFWLKGLEPENQNAFGRDIYIHGTVEESKIGRPASFGCIRMRSRDVIALYNTVGVGARVQIVNASIPSLVAGPARAPDPALKPGT